MGRLVSVVFDADPPHPPVLNRHIARHFGRSTASYETVYRVTRDPSDAGNPHVRWDEASGTSRSQSWHHIPPAAANQVQPAASHRL